MAWRALARLGGRETQLEEVEERLTASKVHPFAQVGYYLGRSQDGRMGPSRSLRWQQPSISRLGLTLLALGFKGTLCQSTPTIRRTGRSDTGGVLVI